MNDRVIYKYPLEFRPGMMEGRESIALPEWHEILSAHDQDDRIFIWAIVPLYAEQYKEIDVPVYIIGTGIPYGSTGDYRMAKFLGTVVMKRSEYVYHIFLGEPR